MASEYSVNIRLNTAQVKKDLKTIGTEIANLGKKQDKSSNKTLSSTDKRVKAETQIATLQKRTQAIRNSILKLDLEGAKVSQIKSKLTRADNQADAKKFDLSKKNIALALKELEILKQQTIEVGKQSKVRGGNTFKFPMGASSPLNFGPGGQLLPGPGGRGFDFQSALISGGFPLLFGQGPFVGAAGALGGGIGGMFGQMGGFAGGIAATTAATTIQAFTVETGKLGAALNDATKDVEAVSAALGITGTEFEKNLKTLQKLGGEEAAFEAARQKMINLVGKEGVDALQRFGKGTTELANQFTIAMTQMRAAFASFLQGTGAGSFLLNRMTAANLQRQAQTSTDPGVVEARKLVEALEGGFFTRSKEEKALIQANPNITLDQAKKAVEEAQKLANKKEEQASIDKLMDNIQKQRVKNISNEISLLERSFGMTSDEFEIEKQIMQMKEDGEIKDEGEIRNKLKKLQLLQKERQLADETAAAFERMSQSIATDISEGIKGMIRGTSTLNDILSNVLNKLADAAFNMAMFGNMQGTLGGGGLFGSILGGLGSIFSPTPKPLGMVQGEFMPSMPQFRGAKAAGGPVKGGSGYLVGERGPELFTPGVSGMITPNHALGGSTSVVVNVDASGTSVEGDQPNAEELGRLIGAVVQSELIKEKRPGGLLG